MMFWRQRKNAFAQSDDHWISRLFNDLMQIRRNRCARELKRLRSSRPTLEED